MATKTTKTGASTSEPAIPYEQARAELIEVVTKLESGQAPLAESMQLWERGETLAKTCQQWLNGAKERIDNAANA
jgi:exodeoxyribonuclease VII small subunit